MTNRTLKVPLSLPFSKSANFLPNFPSQKELLPKEKQYNLAIVIGRFEPFHAGHGLLLNKALMMADKVLVLVGSSYLPRTIKNPFTYAERAGMIAGYCQQHGIPAENVFIAPLRDYLYSDAAWEKQVQDVVAEHQVLMFSHSQVKTCIVGHKKDDTSYYLDRFPQWPFIDCEEFKLPGLDATNVRHLLFTHKQSITLLQGIVPDSTYKFLEDFVQTAEYDRLVREYVADQAYRASWASAPFPPIFVTTDAVIMKSGHILMVRRKDAPGEGLYALPGGFIEAHQQIFDSCIREIYEETNIDLPRAVLKGAVAKDELAEPIARVFGNPKRSTRGRTITHAYFFNLDNNDSKSGLPKVKGGDDAAEAKWIPVNEVMSMSEFIFEDHLSIISRTLGL